MVCSVSLITDSFQFMILSFKSCMTNFNFEKKATTYGPIRCHFPIFGLKILIVLYRLYNELRISHTCINQVYFETYYLPTNQTENQFLRVSNSLSFQKIVNSKEQKTITNINCLVIWIGSCHLSS